MAACKVFILFSIRTEHLVETLNLGSGWGAAMKQDVASFSIRHGPVGQPEQTAEETLGAESDRGTVGSRGRYDISRRDSTSTILEARRSPSVFGRKCKQDRHWQYKPDHFDLNAAQSEHVYGCVPAIFLC